MAHLIPADVADRRRLSDRCPVDGQQKRIGHGFCTGCTNVLPSHMKDALSSKGTRFAEAYEQAGRCIIERKQPLGKVRDDASHFAQIDYKRA